MSDFDVPTFLKWAGGKTQLLPQYVYLFPKHFKGYFEPFLGSGAVFFYVQKKLRPKRVFLSDVNEELINCWKTVQKKPDILISLLLQHKHLHSGEHYYKEVRALDPKKLSPEERASRLIYLNKTCFNGLYRVNSSGQFNVPYGRHANPGIFKEQTLQEAHDLLKGVRLEAFSFEKIEALAKRGDFVYFDPPYYPLSKTANFTHYAGNGFGEEEQKALADLYKKLDKKGCLLMLSNSDTDFIRQLYDGYDIKVARARRVISCIGSKRGLINEIVVLNYEP